MEVIEDKRNTVKPNYIQINDKTSKDDVNKLVESLNLSENDLKLVISFYEEAKKRDN